MPNLCRPLKILMKSITGLYLVCDRPEFKILKLSSESLHINPLNLKHPWATQVLTFYLGVPLSPFPISVAPQSPHFELLLADSKSQILCGPFKSSLFMNIRWCLHISVGPSSHHISLSFKRFNINCHGPRRSSCFITVL